MAGNVLEWAHSKKKEYPYQANDGREDESASGSRVLRGGFFGIGFRFARCTDRREDDIYSLHQVVGFRVVASTILS